MYSQELNFVLEFEKILERIEAAKIKINITRRQCTSSSLQEVLSQKPLGLHFSGHGIPNSQVKDPSMVGEGDFLLLETKSGEGELVSQQMLKKMIRQSKCELKFVFVATCHSEFVGRIF